MIWNDMAAWLRAYIISTVWELSDRETVRQKLSRMPMEFVNHLRLFLGDQNSNAFADLLSGFISYLEAIIDALKNGDDAAVNEYMEQIHEVIHHTTAMLSQINPFWQESEWRDQFFRFLILTIDEANAFLSGDYVKSTEIFDTLLSHAARMSDYFSYGLNEYHTSS